jgi:chromosome segregation ATPase
MMELFTVQNVISVLGLLITGGVLAKLMDVFLIPKSKKLDIELDMAADIRKELYSERNLLNEEINKLKDEFDKWKKEYWDLYENYKNLNSEYSAQKKEIDRLNKRIKELENYKLQAQKIIINKVQKALAEFTNEEDRDRIIGVIKNELL